jgi:hypothetical protein
MDGSIASAVMLPDAQDNAPDPSASPDTSQKRRQSSVSEHDAKRQRLISIDANANADDQNSTTAKPAPQTTTGRKERGRERRLFGAVLGTLSQNSTTPAQKRRSEIEKRQKAQRELEEQESDQRKMERNMRRKAQREKEQSRYEEESVRDSMMRTPYHS